MLFIDRVYLFCKFLYIFLEALIPDVVVSVIIALVVHFQPVLEDRSVQDLGRAARQFVDNSASGQLIELLCLFTQIFVIFSDLRIAVNSFRVSQVDGTDLLVDSGDHRASDELRIQGCALHLRTWASSGAIMLDSFICGAALRIARSFSLEYSFFSLISWALPLMSPFPHR